MILLSRLLSICRRFAQRSWSDRGLLVIVTVVAGIMWGAVRLVSLRRLDRWTTVANDDPLPNDAPPLQRILWAVEAVVPRLFRTRPCLTQALTARVLLAQRGVQTHLRLGVARRPDDGRLQAHAWLERNGYVLTGGDDGPEHYIPLPFPSSLPTQLL